MPRPLLLMILDGWGMSPVRDNNAVALADPPIMGRLLAEYPMTTLQASGMAVGLPAGQMGNSEVGHLNIGAGRVVYQELSRISKAIDDGSFFENQVLLDSLGKLRTASGRLHLAGLLSDGGVHSHVTHLIALLELARRNGINEVFVHCFLDGRDTPPQSADGYITELEQAMADLGIGRIATVMGRFYAMDRDNRWDRVEKAYRAMVHGEGRQADSAAQAVADSHAAGITDEFVLPAVVTAPGGSVGTMGDDDGVIFFNFRADRVRELTRAFTESGFSCFPVAGRPQLASFVCMTEYDETFALPVAFAPEGLKNIFGEVLSAAGLRQLRIAETEKYAHVTFFFNGGNEAHFPGEDRVLIPSPRDVATYDLKPEMSALQLTDTVLERIATGNYDVIVLNFANPDMVGHTGVLEAAIRAIRTVDSSVGRIVERVLAVGGALLITADHGNAETMADPQGHPHTAHTCNPVPCILVDDRRRGASLRPGALEDIAPTLLHLLGIAQPAEMTGRSLLLE